MATTLTEEKFKEGISYAEDNFLNEQASHLKVDKQLFRERMNLNGKRILDFGCGMGGMSLWYAKNWECQVVGVDIDPHHIEIARHLQQKFNTTNVRFEKRNILENPFETPFDLVILNDVVEHLASSILNPVFKAIYRTLKDDGQLFVSFPPWESPYASHLTHVIKIPWCQFLPRQVLHKLIENHNRPIVGALESDLRSAYQGLNKMTVKKLKPLLKENGFQVAFRKSHSILSRMPGLRESSFRFFPFNYLITKEFIIAHKEV